MRQGRGLDQIGTEILILNEAFLFFFEICRRSGHRAHSLRSNLEQ